jgi:hypothetical protein
MNKIGIRRTTLRAGILLVTCLSNVSTSSAQYESLNPRNWLPLEVGNYWHYDTDELISDVWVLHSERDTVINGQRWVLFKEIFRSGPSQEELGLKTGWKALTSDFYILELDGAELGDPNTRRPDSLPPTVPSALTSTVADTSFPVTGSNDSLRVSISVVDEGSEVDSTNLILNVGPTPQFPPINWPFIYKVGWAAWLKGARVNGIDWGEQSVIDQAIALDVERHLSSELAASISFDVYPNPFTSRAEILVSVSAPGLYRTEVFDAIGKRVFVDVQFIGAGSRRRFGSRWSEGLSAGTYLIRIADESGNTANQPVVSLK